jgi:hypothetical protein
VPEFVAVPVVVQGACTGVVFGDVGVVFGAMVPGEVCVDGCVPGVLVPFAGTVPGVVVPVLPGVVVLPGVWVVVGAVLFGMVLVPGVCVEVPVGLLPVCEVTLAGGAPLF